jgi:hypothetical protein
VGFGQSSSIHQAWVKHLEDEGRSERLERVRKVAGSAPRVWSGKCGYIVMDEDMATVVD